jgi:co-chaperonin GroES (HSP10)
MRIEPLRGNIFAVMQVGERRSAGGIYIMDDNGKEQGIRPRWGKVWKVAKDINYLKPGQWILCEHGRWTLGIRVKDDNGDEFIFSKIDPNGIMCVQDELPEGLEDIDLIP